MEDDEKKARRKRRADFGRRQRSKKESAGIGEERVTGKMWPESSGEGRRRMREESALEFRGRETDPRGRAVEGGPVQHFAEASIGSFVRKLFIKGSCIGIGEGEGDGKIVALKEREGERAEETGEGEGGAGKEDGVDRKASIGSFMPKLLAEERLLR